MIRKGLLASALSGALLVAAPAQASVELSSISNVINQLHNNSVFQPGSLSFGINYFGYYQPIFSGVEGVHQFSGISSFSNWANQPYTGGSTSSSFDDYQFTFTAVGSYFGNSYNLPSVDTGANAPSAYSAMFVSTPVPEPGTWGMMIVGFGVIGIAMRRRRYVISSFS